jgi:5-methylcytosine-specific restriction endonuclease McrA
LAHPEKVRATMLRRLERQKEQKRIAREAKGPKLPPSAEEIAAREERRKAARRASYLANADRHREKSKAWRAANPGRMAELLRDWKERNRDKVRTAKRSRKIIKRAALIEDLTHLQRGRCAYCRCKLGADLHIDHVMPLALGGPNERSNLQLACASCNMAKSATHPVEHARSLGRLI